MFLNVVYTAASGTPIEHLVQGVESLLVACHQHLDLTGLCILHPAGQTQLCGFPVDEPPKANALNPPGDEKV
jgi:hypothetical protein